MENTLEKIINEKISETQHKIKLLTKEYQRYIEIQEAARKYYKANKSSFEYRQEQKFAKEIRQRRIVLRGLAIHIKHLKDGVKTFHKNNPKNMKKKNGKQEAV